MYHLSQIASGLISTSISIHNVVSLEVTHSYHLSTVKYYLVVFCNMTKLIYFKNQFFVSHPHPFLDLLKKYPSVYKYANKALVYIPKEELLLTRLCYHEPVANWTAKETLMGIFTKKKDIKGITIIHDKESTPKLALEQLAKKVKYYQQWYYLSFAGLPFSMLFTVMPGPNVVLLYNLFRLYSYKHAFDGIGLLNNANIVYCPQEGLEQQDFDKLVKKYELK